MPKERGFSKLKLLLDLRKILGPLGLVKLVRYFHKSRKQSMTPYPELLPLECAQKLVKIIKERSVEANKQEFAHCVWNVQGYIQRMILGSPDDLHAAAPPLSEEDQLAECNCLLELEGELCELDEAATFSAGPDEAALDPATILLLLNTLGPMLLKLLQKLRERRNS